MVANWSHKFKYFPIDIKKVKNKYPFRFFALQFNDSPKCSFPRFPVKREKEKAWNKDPFRTVKILNLFDQLF